MALPCLALVPAAHAQISLSSAVDLALSNSPRVKMAESDVVRAKAGVDEAHDIYIPSLVASSSAGGYSYGFPLGTPTVYSFSAQSLVFSFSQKDYIRSARAGLDASDHALQDIREQIEEDTINTYLALQHDQQARDALQQEGTYASRLEGIVKERLDAGRDTPMEYTKARRTGVQVRLQILQLDDAIVIDQDHLSRLIGSPGASLVAQPGSIPALPSDSSAPSQPLSTGLVKAFINPNDLPDSAGVEAAYSTARSKREQAFGDARYLWRPQFSFGAQYSRFSTYNNTYVVYYPSVDRPGLSENAVGFALNVQLPMFDQVRRDRARASAAEATHSEQEARLDRDQFREGRLRLERSMAELKARAELASLDRDLAQEQLDILLVQLQAAPGSGAVPMTPKDEQNARILERQRYIDMLDSEFQLRQTTIKLLRQTGGLTAWLHGTSASTSPTPPTP